MAIKINYYGILTDITKCSSEELNIDTNDTLAQLKQLLMDKYQGFSKITLAFFIDSKRADLNCILTEGVVIECMPPFAGG